MTTAQRTSADTLTTRLLKGGALLPDMRQLVVAAWHDPEVAASEEAARQALTKPSLARMHDTYTRVFRPRFVEGSPRDAWKLAAEIERHSPDIDVVRPFYYWVTARAEPLLYQFATTELFARLGAADREVRIGETVAWISSRLESAGKA